MSKDDETFKALILFTVLASVNLTLVGIYGRRELDDDLMVGALTLTTNVFSSALFINVVVILRRRLMKPEDFDQWEAVGFIFLLSFFWTGMTSGLAFIENCQLEEDRCLHTVTPLYPITVTYLSMYLILTGVFCCPRVGPFCRKIVLRMRGPVSPRELVSLVADPHDVPVITVR